LEKPTALVVEDDTSVGGMVCYFLELQGIRCLHIVAAEEAWAVLGDGPIDMAVIDVRLRGKDGWWLLERMRADDRFTKIPVVVMTGSRDKALAERARQLDSQCLVKPFSYDDLNERLDRAANGQRR